MLRGRPSSRGSGFKPKRRSKTGRNLLGKTLAIGESYFRKRSGEYVFYPHNGGGGYVVSQDDKERFVRWFGRVGLVFASFAGPGGALLLTVYEPNLIPFVTFLALFMGAGYVYQARWVNSYIGDREQSEPERSFRARLWAGYLATPNWLYIAIISFFFALAIASGALAYAMISFGGDWTLFPLSCLSLLFANIYLAWTMYVWEHKDKKTSELGL